MVRVLFMTNSVKNNLQLLRPTLKWTIFSQLTRFDATHWQNLYFFLIGQFIYLDQIQFCILFLTLWKTGTPPVLFLAAVRRNAACVQAWSDFSHLQCIDQCSCPSLASLQWIAIAFRMFAFSVSFIVFSIFFMLSVNLCAVMFCSPF